MEKNPPSRVVVDLVSEDIVPEEDDDDNNPLHDPPGAIPDDIFFVPDMVEKRITRMYAAVKKRSDLLGAVDTDFLEDIPPTVGPYYGELTKGGFSLVLDAFIAAGMNNRSTFLDIGSGYGKPTFHAFLKTGAKCTGIEYVPERVRVANELKNTMQLDVNFQQGDITSFETLNYDFIYFYDYLSTMIADKVEEILLNSRFVLFASFVKRGAESNLVLVKQIKVRTTGKQTFICYLYKLPSRFKRLPTGRDDEDDPDEPELKRTRYHCWNCGNSATHVIYGKSTRFWCRSPDCYPAEEENP